MIYESDADGDIVDVTIVDVEIPWPTVETPDAIPLLIDDDAAPASGHTMIGIIVGVARTPAPVVDREASGRAAMRRYMLKYPPKVDQPLHLECDDRSDYARHQTKRNP